MSVFFTDLKLASSLASMKIGIKEKILFFLFTLLGFMQCD